MGRSSAVYSKVRLTNGGMCNQFWLHQTRFHAPNRRRRKPVALAGPAAVEPWNVYLTFDIGEIPRWHVGLGWNGISLIGSMQHDVETDTRVSPAHPVNLFDGTSTTGTTSCQPDIHRVHI